MNNIYGIIGFALMAILCLLLEDRAGMFGSLVITFVLIAENNILARVDQIHGRIVIETIAKIKEEIKP